MINVEPTPCGRYVFGSMLLIVEGRPMLLNARRAIPPQKTHDGFKLTLEALAAQVIAEILSKASQCGLSMVDIAKAVDDCYDPVMPKRA